ncbi:MAG TPA: transcriptional regulator [Anaerolineaceae bacterium]|jgi:hypothetical protein|nr:transcriptional regulator [Anaerolineaceae bacterium]
MANCNTENSSTITLLKKLFNSPDLEIFMESNESEMTTLPFHAFLSGICTEKGEIPEHIIRRSAIDRTYGHQLFNGTRRPSRDKVLQLAIGLELNFDETQKLLQVAQKSSLYPKIKRDAAIIHCIRNKKEINETQAVLQALGLTPLSRENQ